ncbi:uncharacterized protein LOC126908316 [Daktulosphaira vitifoliae]|uniref:uncharacterized protein LOC126908316 n=1 Tax=Daktulosphaira vitifoliae TaxID=58002 RepID=UPI0021AAAB3D|nr:uncharacterized protein LOC126908316 [Daktulosphaira vitifoliae]
MLSPSEMSPLDIICANVSSNPRNTSQTLWDSLQLIQRYAFNVIYALHALSLSLSRVLQAENQDLVEAVKLADAAKHELEERRQYSTDNFNTIFVTVEDICNKYNIPVNKPRLASRQINRSNIITDSHRNILSNFSCLFPIETKSLDKDSCKKLFETYCSILHDDSPEIWINEIEIWRRRQAGKNIRNALDALDICNSDSFPNVHKMLCVMSVLPVTTVTNERSFSTLRRLKTYLRSSMGEDRLNGLASLDIHRDINVDINEVLNEFFSTHRRLNLLKK